MNICVKVDHAYSRACFGISLEHRDWKIVFSGDTMPCDNLVKHGGYFGYLVNILLLSPCE